MLNNLILSEKAAFLLTVTQAIGLVAHRLCYLRFLRAVLEGALIVSDVAVALKTVVFRHPVESG